MLTSWPQNNICELYYYPRYIYESFNNDFDEEKHPRGDDGRFVSIKKEKQALSDVYDEVYKHPFDGAPDEVLAMITIDDLKEAIAVHRGPAFKDGDSVRVQGKKLQKRFGSNGYGLVKIIFLHGE